MKRYYLGLGWLLLVIMLGLLPGCGVGSETPVGTPAGAPAGTATVTATATAAVSASATAAAAAAAAAAAFMTDISAQEAYRLIQANRERADFVILDVRTQAEYAAGHLENARLVDVNLASFRTEMEKMDRQSTYLVYCRTGNRSKTALAIMLELGFSRIYHLQRGITEWQSEGLPVVR